MHRTFIIELKCRFCSQKIGEHKVLEDFGWTEEKATAENCGFVDLRCDACNVNFGTYKDLENFHEQETGETPQQFEDFMKTGSGKAESVCEKVIKQKPKNFLLKTHRYAFAEKYKNDLLEELRVKDKGIDEQVEKVQEHFNK